MIIYDISQEVFSCNVFPGDDKPHKIVVKTIDDTNIYNLTNFSMCAHNGTHIDAPYHFYSDGKTVDEISLESVIGLCYVTFAEGAISEKNAIDIIDKARKANEESAKRILIGGDCFVTLEAAKVFSMEKVLLVGNESQTVGPLEAPAQVHYELLGNDIVLLEGIRLNNIDEGVYYLNASPLNLAGSDGAPCRAVLVKSKF